MEPSQPKMVLWTGPKHSGKTTAAQRLIERVVAEGFSVAGVLAPAIYQDGILMGFDAVEVSTGFRRPLARRTEKPNRYVGSFAFCEGGLRLGYSALLCGRTRSSALIMVDEYGPLELRGEGWRGAVDRLMSDSSAMVLLVVREELADDVARLYAEWGTQQIAAADPRAAAELLEVLRARSCRTESGRASMSLTVSPLVARST